MQGAQTSLESGDVNPQLLGRLVTRVRPREGVTEPSDGDQASGDAPVDLLLKPRPQDGIVRGRHVEVLELVGNGAAALSLRQPQVQRDDPATMTGTTHQAGRQHVPLEQPVGPVSQASPGVIHPAIVAGGSDKLRLLGAPDADHSQDGRSSGR